MSQEHSVARAHHRDTCTSNKYNRHFNFRGREFLLMPYRSDLPVPLNELEADSAFFDAQVHLSDKPASLPVPNSTHSFWLHPSKEVNPLAKEGSEGPIISDTDICIIGSGITGVSSAFHLSRLLPEKKVVILEARDFCTFSHSFNRMYLNALRKAREPQGEMADISLLRYIKALLSSAKLWESRRPRNNPRSKTIP